MLEAARMPNGSDVVADPVSKIACCYIAEHAVIEYWKISERPSGAWFWVCGYSLFVLDDMPAHIPRKQRPLIMAREIQKIWHFVLGEFFPEVVFVVLSREAMAPTMLRKKIILPGIFANANDPEAIQNSLDRLRTGKTGGVTLQ